MTLRERRLARGLSLKQVGDAVEVTHATMHHWELGVRKPLEKHWRRLAAFYGCTVEEIKKDYLPQTADEVTAPAEQEVSA